jgi:hypothetical protein
MQLLQDFAQFEVIDRKRNVRGPILASLVEDPIDNLLELPDEFLRYDPTRCIKNWYFSLLFEVNFMFRATVLVFCWDSLSFYFWLRLWASL